MKKLATMLFVLTLSMGSVLAQNVKEQTFVGNISDSSCGLKHTMMPGKSDKECTVACVNMGSKYVLADHAKKVVYQLDDQKTPEKFAGELVKVTGTLDKKTKTIKVKGIEPTAQNPCNPCAKKKEKNPCNPGAKKKGENPCNPCAKKKEKNPCNPCAKKKKGKNPCNPCGKKRP